MLSRLITRLEAALFGHRLPFLLALAGFTALMGVLGAKLHDPLKTKLQELIR